MNSIEIDFDVFKALTVRRASEEVSYNDVLRELLGLNGAKSVAPATSTDGTAWLTKGVSFPLGTEFRASYKGQAYYGKVENGALMVDGKQFSSPSSAAVAITGKPVNGWVFWECRFPGKSSWTTINSLRKKLH